MNKGCWEVVEVLDDDEFNNLVELQGEVRNAYIDIMATINEIIYTGFNPRWGN